MAEQERRALLTVVVYGGSRGGKNPLFLEKATGTRGQALRMTVGSVNFMYAEGLRMPSVLTSANNLFTLLSNLLLPFVETVFLPELGGYLASKNINVVYGGSKFGLLGAMGDAVIANCGKLTGIVPEFFTSKFCKGMFIIPSVHVV